MADAYTHPLGWNDAVNFPTKPTSETQARALLQEQHDQILTFHNNHMADIVAHGSVLRQAIINGGFQINQRVVLSTVTLAAGAYGHDRWKAGSSGCTYTFVTVENVTTITITAGSLQQVIEDINLITGTYTLSWVGTSQGKIGAGSYGASGITGSVTGGINLTIEFGIGTLSKVQFNYGSIALPFSPKSFDAELKSCQRYLKDLYGTYRMDYYTANALNFPFSSSDMRVQPTLVNNGIESTDWVVATTSWGSAGTGWSLSAVATNMISSTKTAHGVTDGIFEVMNKGKVFVNAEL